MFSICFIILIAFTLALALVGGGYLFEAVLQWGSFTAGMCITGGIIVALAFTLAILGSITIIRYPQDFEDVIGQVKKEEDKHEDK